MLYDPNEEYGSGQTFADEFSEREALAEQEMLSKAADIENNDEEKDVELEEITIPGSEYDSVITAISRIAELYFSAPASFAASTRW